MWLGASVPYGSVDVQPRVDVELVGDADYTMMKTRISRQVQGKSNRQVGLVMAAGVLGGMLAGCGSPASDPVSAVDSRTATVNTAKGSGIHGSGLDAQGTGQVSDARVSERTNRPGPSDRTSVAQPEAVDKSDEQTEERHASISPDIPDAIAKDLGSPDPHIRSRALEYWETQLDQPPLTPVFEAMEDEDPAVRAKAGTIVERHMDMVKEQEGE